MNTPEIVDVEGFAFLFRVGRCQHTDLGPMISQLFEEITSENPCIEMTGSPVVYYMDWREEDCDIEAGFQVADGMVPGGGAKVRVVPDCCAVSATYEGAYDGLAAAWMELWAYVKDNNIEVGGAPWDLYVTPPEPTPDRSVTEIYIPLRNITSKS